MVAEASTLRSRLLRSLRGITLIAAPTLGCGWAFADTLTANAVMPGCREFLVPDSGREAWGQSYCVGLINGLAYGDHSCAPPGVTTAQTMRVIVQYIDSRPARMHEDFRKLAREATKAAWPCPR
jgi:hypothetical protein